MLVVPASRRILGRTPEEYRRGISSIKTRWNFRVPRIGRTRPPGSAYVIQSAASFERWQRGIRGANRPSTRENRSIPLDADFIDDATLIARNISTITKTTSTLTLSPNGETSNAPVTNKSWILPVSLPLFLSLVYIEWHAARIVHHRLDVRIHFLFRSRFVSRGMSSIAGVIDCRGKLRVSVIGSDGNVVG